MGIEFSLEELTGVELVVLGCHCEFGSFFSWLYRHLCPAANV